MKKNVSSIILTIIFLFYAQYSHAQSTEDINTLKEEIKLLKEGQAALKKDVEEIKNLLKTKQQAPPPFRETDISVENDRFRGDEKARLALIEFSDYQ